MGSTRWRPTQTPSGSDGAALTIDDSAKHTTYGEMVTGHDVLIEQSVDESPVTETFLSAVREMTPAMAK